MVPAPAIVRGAVSTAGRRNCLACAKHLRIVPLGVSPPREGRDRVLRKDGEGDGGEYEFDAFHGA
jgi:hypothetical protein